MARRRSTNKKERMAISFSEYDEEVFDFLEQQKNTSCFIKQLVREYMSKNITTETLKDTVKEANLRKDSSNNTHKLYSDRNFSAKNNNPIEEIKQNISNKIELTINF